jgi:hypothetical protein
MKDMTEDGPGSSPVDPELEHLQVEAAASRSELKELLDLLPVAMMEIELASMRITRTNRVARIVMGFDPDGPAPELSVHDVLPPEEVQRLLSVTAEFLAHGLQPDGTYHRTGKQEIHETIGRRRDGTTFPVEFQSMFVLGPDGLPFASRVTFRDISERKAIEEERERLLAELQTALADVRKLQGLLPICAWCQRVRDDRGYWSKLEAYVQAHSGAEFSHGICPSCAAQFSEVPVDDPDR